MRIKVKNGTRPDVDLCRTCRFATIVEGPANTQKIKQCSQLGRVPFPVVSCNDWEDTSATDLWDMKQIAWVVELKGTRRVGFLSPDQRRKNGDPDMY